VPFLIIVSLLWAVSFGLAGQVSPLGAPLVTAVRMALAALVFLPLVRTRGLGAGAVLGLAGLGALQFGLMYVFYLQSFHWLHSSEVALFTVFTPLLVTFLGGLLVRRLPWLCVLTSGLAVGGTGICLWTSLGRSGLLPGFLCMQASNACFALGQVLYRRLAPRTGKADHELMGLLYGGAVLVALAMTLGRVHGADFARITATQAAILAYLGIVASGVGFFLFNAGARRVDLGTLAIFNNAKVPLAVLASAFLFHEKVDWLRLGAGGAVIAGALGLNAWGQGVILENGGLPEPPVR
jgi:drug/metabolite transporter (DMT)-like permease